MSVFPLHDNPVPAMMRDDGVAKNDAHSVEDADEGMRNQSALESNPRFDAEAVGILNVTVPVLVAIAKSVPDDPTANVNAGPVAPLIVADDVATVAHAEPFDTMSCPVAEL